MNEYKTFKVTIENHVASIAFNRPSKSNAINQTGWAEMKAIFEEADANPEIRVIVLSGEGKNFCAGIDLAMLMNLEGGKVEKCEGRRREKLRKTILYLQSCITAIEDCRKPVLAAIHNACIGGGVDIVSACDMRYCTEKTYFCVKEVDLGLVADIGTMQRLPKILNHGMAAELVYTGRNVLGAEAKEIGLVNQVYADKEGMMESVMKIAQNIASKSPLVIRGTKEMLLYTRDHNVKESLNYMATWNAAMLYSDDLMESFQAFMQKRRPKYEN